MYRLASFQRFQKIGNLVDECVFVTDVQTGNPPIAHVRHVTIANVNTAPTTHNRVVTMIKVLQAVKVVQIPADRCMLTIDLEGIKGFVAAGIPSRLEQTE